MTELQGDPRRLEAILLPLLDPQQALTFLRDAVPEILSEMEREIQEGSRVQVQHNLERIRSVRRRVHQAQNQDDLEHISDTHLLPSLFLDARSDVWDTWNRPKLRRDLQEAQTNLGKTRNLLDSIEPGTLQFHRTREQMKTQEKALFEIQRHVLLEWLQDEEQRIRAHARSEPVQWNVETRLQIPLVVDRQVLDFIDAEMTVTATTSHAFLTRTFAVIVLDKETPLVAALRRINLIRHFIPSDTTLIVVTSTPNFASVLKQHNIHVYVMEESAS